MPLETAGITAEYDPDLGLYTVWSNYGGPMALQTVMAAALGVPINKLRLVVPPRIGGNFGLKQAMYPYMLLMGTAWGLAPEIIDGADHVLAPIGDHAAYNHLSVRCAAAIIMDRLTTAKAPPHDENTI